MSLLWFWRKEHKTRVSFQSTKIFGKTLVTVGFLDLASDIIILLFLFIRSLSYVLATGSMAFALLLFFYILIDITHVWSGEPLIYPGKNLNFHIFKPWIVYVNEWPFSLIVDFFIFLVFSRYEFNPHICVPRSFWTLFPHFLDSTRDSRLTNCHGHLGHLLLGDCQLCSVLQEDIFLHLTLPPIRCVHFTFNEAL